jgi:5-methylcytosine-specific restriction endonuclease McrA
MDKWKRPDVIAYQKEYRATHKAEIADNKRDWVEKHKDEVTEYKRNYAIEHKTTLAIAQMAWKEAHRAELTEYKRLYYLAHKDVQLARQKANYDVNKAVILERQRKYVDTHKEAIAERNRRYGTTHKEAISKRGKAYRKTENGMAFRYAANLRRKAQKRGAGKGEYSTAALVAARHEYWGNRCYICGKQETKTERLQTDHVKPLAKGGAHLPCNLRPICGPCNSKKHNKWPIDFRTFEKGEK